MKSLPNDFISNIHNYGINPRSREIFLHGNIECGEEEPGVDYRMASTFLKNILLLNRQNSSTIYIHMNSVGGDWNYGMAIYDAIKASVAPVVIVAYSHARSMTSIILQAADHRLLAPNADFMIHYGSLSIDDTVMGAITASEWTKRSNDVMLNIYAERCQQGDYFRLCKNPKYAGKDGLMKIKRFLDRKMKDHQEWYLSAEEAVNYGFADGVLGKEIVLKDVLTNNIDVVKANWKN